MKIKDIQKGYVFTIVALQIDALISGAWKAGFHKNGRITLCYTDGEKESYIFQKDEAQAILDKGMENFFSVVSSVQSCRVAK